MYYMTQKFTPGKYPGETHAHGQQCVYADIGGHACTQTPS